MFNYLNRYKWFRKRSKTPYFSLVNSEITPDNNVSLELEWNDAFIQVLRKNGYTGVDDEAIIAQYITQISRIANIQD